MNDKKRDFGSNADPHFDGKYESIINDPTATQGEQMGIRMDFTAREENPFKVDELNNDGMKAFQKLTRGKNVVIDK